MLSTDSSTVTMIYDALDRMIEQTRSSGHTEIVYGPYGLKLALMNGQSLVNAFVKLPGGSSAVYGASGLAYYRHADHLGSSRLATTPTRTKYYDVAYAPYGEDYNGSGTTPDLAFTDENQDTVKAGWSTNLYDFMLREYRPAHGRWTQPDPAGMGVVDPTNPQTWNRYAYVLNNPMAMIDMLGDDDCYFGPDGMTMYCYVNEPGGGCGWFCNTTSPYPGQTCDPNNGSGVNCNPPQNPPQLPNGCPSGNCSGQGGGAGGSRSNSRKPNGGFPGPPGFREAQCKAVTNEAEQLDQVFIVAGIVTMWAGEVTYPYTTGIGIADLMAHRGKAYWCN